MSNVYTIVAKDHETGESRVISVLGNTIQDVWDWAQELVRVSGEEIYQISKVVEAIPDATEWLEEKVIH